MTFRLEREIVERVTHDITLGSGVAKNECSHKIDRQSICIDGRPGRSSRIFEANLVTPEISSPPASQVGAKQLLPLTSPSNTFSAGSTNISSATMPRPVVFAGSLAVRPLMSAVPPIKPSCDERPGREVRIRQFTRCQRPGKGIDECSRGYGHGNAHDGYAGAIGRDRLDQAFRCQRSSSGGSRESETIIKVGPAFRP